MNAPLPSEPGIRISLTDLIEMRHRVREVQLFSTPSQRSPLIGLHHSKFRGRGVDFDQVRVYQAGDDVRTIDWRVTARTQEPHTKLFHEERERPIFIMVEQSTRLFFGSGLMFKSVLAAQAAALIGWAALGHNDRVGGLVFGDNEHYEIKPRRSKQSLLQLLNRLVKVNQSLHSEREPDRDALGVALRRAREVLRPGSLVIVICDERALSDSAEQQLSLLSRHCDLLLLPLSDPLDHALPAAGLLRFAERGAQLELDTLNFELRQTYRAQAEARIARWELLAQKLRVLLMPLSTQSEMVEQMREFLNPQRPGEQSMNGLEQLQPLISPPPIDFWPPAPGWWLLLLLLPLLGFAVWRLRRFIPIKKRPIVRAEQPLDPVRIAALAELAQMPKPYDGAPAGAWLQQLNGLLKRLCRNHYPYSQSHTLNGRKWLAFLDNRCPAAGLTRWMVLVEGAYKPECKLDDKAIAGLTQAVDTWIRKHV